MLPRLCQAFLLCSLGHLWWKFSVLNLDLHLCITSCHQWSFGNLYAIPWHMHRGCHEDAGQEGTLGPDSHTRWTRCTFVSTTATNDSSLLSVTPLANQRPSLTTCVLRVAGLYDSSRPDALPCTADLMLSLLQK